MAYLSHPSLHAQYYVSPINFEACGYEVFPIHEAPS
jgi:hypothetical protein